VVIHQLTDLPREFDEARITASYVRNARIRIEGTRNLIAAAQQPTHIASSCRALPLSIRVVASRIRKTDPLDPADPALTETAKVQSTWSGRFAGTQHRWHRAAIWLPLRSRYLVGNAARKPSVHIDAAAHAALLAVTRGAVGSYNIADEGGMVSIAKARNELASIRYFASGQRAHASHRINDEFGRNQN